MTCFFFFFSSRRRHTRCSRDWSSDVCSSDLAGNGGSAADAQHLATEYVVRYQTSRPALRALALTTDTSLLTACANDMGFDEVFARQLDALARPGDVLSLHSTSGESPNLIPAAQAARARGGTVIALLGKSGGQLAAFADVALVGQ